MRIASKLISFLLSVILTISGWFCSLPAHTLRADKSLRYQTHEGFGTSSAWWAQQIDDASQAEEIARLLYDKQSGLGLEIFRYNVGAGSAENPDSVIRVESRKTESFLVKNNETGEFEYDFSRDANARRVLDLAVRRGAKKIILFCNSPHWSMTRNGLASGSMTEGESNLSRDRYEDFVDYLLTIADHFVAEGYPVYGISPINEPQWNWGSGWVSQEGCHYSPEETVALLECFAVEMQKRGVSYKLLGPESGQMDWQYIQYETAFYNSEILRNYCDTFSGHSYWMDGNDGQKKYTAERFANDYPGLKFEMSEWCELPMELDPLTIESGLRMANVLYEDLVYMNAVSWQSWTAVNGDGVLDRADGQLIKYKRYAVYKQFSVIPTGAQRVGILDSHMKKSTLKTVCYVDDSAQYFVIINNENEPNQVRFPGLFRSAKAFETTSEADNRPVEVNRKSPVVTIAPNSVTTVILQTGISGC